MPQGQTRRDEVFGENVVESAVGLIRKWAILLHIGQEKKFGFTAVTQES